MTNQPDWRDDIFNAMKAADIRIVSYVPDAGHAHVITRCAEDNDIEDVALTTEEEGVALATGAWLGGKKSVLLMQSSGVGNCINMLSLRETARVPMVILVFMHILLFMPTAILLPSYTPLHSKQCNQHDYRPSESATFCVNIH